MTADHLHPELLSQAASILARDHPKRGVGRDEIGKVDNFEETRRGVRVIVVGDVMRRLVARTMAKQVAKKAEEATAPFQYALTTKAGCECVAITDLDKCNSGVH